MLLIIIQTSCATYKEPQGDRSTLALVQGSSYRESFCDFGGTYISDIDDKWVGMPWTGLEETKVLPGKHKFTLSSSIYNGCVIFSVHYIAETKIIATLHAGNKYRFIYKDVNKKKDIKIIDQNENKIPMTILSSVISYQLH